jgi:hypothetical protein
LQSILCVDVDSRESASAPVPNDDCPPPVAPSRKRAPPVREASESQNLLQAEPAARNAKKRITLNASSKASAQQSVSWESTICPTESMIMELANQKELSFVQGFSALHWASEGHHVSLVQTIIDKALVHPDTLSLHENFISFTPIFSGISSLWLTAQMGSEVSTKEQRNVEAEQSCLSIMKLFAVAGATLDSEVEVRIANVNRRFTLLHAAASYACLFGVRAFKKRQSFLLEVARILAEYLAPSECALLFWRRCEVDGQHAVSVRQ